MNDEIDLVEISEHDFRVLVRPFNSMPFKRMMPMIELSIKSPESPELFRLLVEVFTENLPIDKVSEFENLNMKQASDVIASWMNQE